MVSSLSGLFTYLSFYDFSLEKTLKNRKFMDIAETAEAVMALAGVVATVAGIYIGNGIVVGFGAVFMTLGFFSWYYTGEFHRLADLDATRNTIEQSAKNVQISVTELRERRKILEGSTEKLLSANAAVGDGASKLIAQEHELRKMFTEIKDVNRGMKKMNKEFSDAITSLSEQNLKLRQQMRQLMELTSDLARKENREASKLNLETKRLEDRRAVLKAILPKVQAAMELKFAMEELRILDMETYEDVLKKLPVIKKI